MATISNLAINQGADFSTSVTVNAGAAVTVLASALTDSATTITVNSTTAFPNNGTVIIGNESITFTGTTTTTFTGCTRGASSTTAAAYGVDTTVTMVGQALNLTGYSVLAQLRKSHTSSTATAFGTSISSAADGIIELSLTDTASAAISDGRYVWDLIITDGAGDIIRVVEGIATIRPSVSRS